MFEYLKNKRVLVTGGCGTVGHALAEEFLKVPGLTHAVLSRNEAAQFALKQRFPTVITMLGDIKDENSLERAFLNFKPDVVIHAAAVKVVPVAEREMLNTFETNAMGTYYVAKQCMKHGVEVALMIGTDKQCAPVNVYGMTKHIATSIFSDANRTGKTRFLSTRYGNVLCSRSSLGVIIMDQAKKGNKLTVTDPEMTRFFFTIQEGVRLIDIALRHGYKTPDYNYYGETFSSQMQAVSLGEFFETVAEKFGCEVEVIGRRPGEKTHEDLLAEHEIKDTGLLTEYPYIPFYNKNAIMYQYVTIPHYTEDKTGQVPEWHIAPSTVYSSRDVLRLTKPQIWEMLEYAYNNTWKD